MVRAEETDVARERKVTIIIVNWNGKTDTVACLESVQNIDYPHLEIIVVDNGSTDGSIEFIRRQFPNVVLLEAGKNLGTSGGRNIGIRYALNSGATFVLFLDNDVVVDPQLIVNLVRQADELGGKEILGAKIYYFDEPNRIWYAGAEWNSPGFSHVGMGDADDGRMYNTVRETAYACGCALFVNREILEMIGMLDDRFFCYFEETDFCYRARAAGFRTFFVPSARVWHKVSSSSGGEKSPLFYYFMNRNLLLWAERHLSLSEKLRVYRYIVTVVRRGWRSKYKDPASRATLIGVRDYLLRRFGDCPESIRSLRKMRGGPVSPRV